jgi:hypothetical protein
MDGAGAAERLSAAILRARQSEMLPDNPEQRNIRTRLHFILFSIHFE